MLRKQPPGQLVSKSAHRVDREYYMIQALYKTGRVPVPRVTVLCQDKSVLGSDFYVMDFVQGRIFHSPSFENIGPNDRREWYVYCLL